MHCALVWTVHMEYAHIRHVPAPLILLCALCVSARARGMRAVVRPNITGERTAPPDGLLRNCGADASEEMWPGC